jgi:hypothetical protein
MQPSNWIAIICLVGFLVCGALSLRVSSKVWYRDVEGDGVSARSVCRMLALICLVILVALGVRWLRY